MIAVSSSNTPRFKPQTGPKFGKKSLSFYLRNECPRQFRLSLYDPRLLKSGGMPDRSSNRPLSGQSAQAGDAWQNQVVSDVADIFGSANVWVSPVAPSPPGSTKVARPPQRDLAADMPNLQAHQFVVESIFDLTDAFKSAFGLLGLTDSDGLALEWSRLNPDIIQVLPPQADALWVAPDGNLHKMAATDGRLRLRIIDVKLASEPGAHYFGEIALYSMALASWLIANGWDDKFVVSSQAAVWPGSYELSQLNKEHRRQRTGLSDLSLLLAAMEDDLDLIVFEVYASRLARFFRQELPYLLRTPWSQLEWHPNFRCQNCDYLGYDWQAGLPVDPNVPRQPPDPNHCWQVAEKGNLVCRVPGLTRGGTQKLRLVAPTVEKVAALSPADIVWEAHSNLRGRKQIILARAKALESGTSEIVSASGACATMPSWADLKIYVTLDYDPSSAITAVLSLRADWFEPQCKPESLTHDATLTKHSNNWGRKDDRDGVWTIEARDPDVEWREFRHFLEKLQEIFDFVKEKEKPRIEAGKAVQEAEKARRKAASIKGNVENKEKSSTFQIYLWDDAQFRHLQRLIGRHLEKIIALPNLKGLAWLFPAPQLLQDDALAGRTSPITLVSTVVENHVAVPVPHHYTLLQVVEHFRPADATPPFVKWNFREPLTNLVPSERIHECWSRTKDLAEILLDLKATSRNKTYALSLVTQQLYDEAKGSPGQAPKLQLARSAAPSLPEPVKGITGVPDQARLWYQHLKLNAAIARIEAEIIYAMSPEARELRGKSAHLKRRLTVPSEIEAALKNINAACGTYLKPDADLAIYTLAESSRDVNMKPGEFGALLSPRGEDLFALKTAGPRLKATKARLGADWWQSIEKEGLTGVSIEAIDRENLYVALRLDSKNQMAQFDPSDGADFSRDVMLDALSFDVLSSKVKLTLERIGTPATAPAPGSIASILPPAAPPTTPPVTAKFQPAHEFLYDSLALSQQLTGRQSAPLRALLEAKGVHLNSWQWTAWQEALEKRLSVIWGPPGTGKSATLRAICRAAVLEAQTKSQPLRLLITAQTHPAMDEILHKIERYFASHPVPGLSIYRVQSSLRDAPDLPANTTLRSISLERNTPAAAPTQLLDALKSPGKGIVIVGAIPQQLHNLAQATVQKDSTAQTEKKWFDLVLLDEASQMDVANSTLVLSKIAPNGSCVLAGDNKQMAPIHQAEPPEGQENMVGSIFDYFTEHCGVKKNALNINYRSNATIVDCVRAAGYDDELQSYSPALELNLLSTLPVQQPLTWSPKLPFSPHYATMLNLQHPVGCFIYDDPNLSGQSNDFEAQSVAALLRLLYERMGESKNGRDENGQSKPIATTPYDLDQFWKQGVGVVAPHRAQGSKIVEALRAAFDGTGATAPIIRDAVDTVERFQGQERDFIIASFGLGDPDMVAQEDEFLFKLNRFNVLISRARAKVIVFLSRSVLDHLSDDQDVVRDSALLKSFVESQCKNAVNIDLPYWEQGILKTVSGEFRFS